MDVPQFTPTDKDLLQSMDQGQFKGFSFVNPYFGVQQWVGTYSGHCKCLYCFFSKCCFSCDRWNHVEGRIIGLGPLWDVPKSWTTYLSQGVTWSKRWFKDWAPCWIGNRLYGACFIIALLEDYGRFQISTTTTLSTNRLFAMSTSDHFVDKYTVML